MTELAARADLRGARIDLTLTRSGPERRPDLRVMRRRLAPPATLDDGRLVVELLDLFTADPAPAEPAPWARITRARYLVTNTLAEAGLCQAEVSQYWRAADTTPHQAMVVIYDPATKATVRQVLTGVTAVIVTTTLVAPVKLVRTEIRTQPPLGPPQVWAVEVTTGGPSAQVVWRPATGAVITAAFDRAETQTTTGVVLVKPPVAPLRVVFTTTGDAGPDPLRVVDFTEALSADTNEWQQTLVIADEEPPRPGSRPVGLDPEIAYYYAAFASSKGQPHLPPTDASWTLEAQATAIATGRHGLADRVYELLPSVHRYYDEPYPQAPGQSGQLRRFMRMFGLALDQARSLAEGLSRRHDVLHGRAEDLPHLARWIGWDPDQTLPVATQRADVLFAPDVHASVGTVPNILALIHRETAWTPSVHEFANNVFSTNAPEAVHVWDLWQAPWTGTALTGVAQLTGELTPSKRARRSFDGRPAGVQVGTTTWLFWHRMIGERRVIMLQRLGAGATPAAPADPGGQPADTFNDEYPAATTDGTTTWLFWSTNRDGRWNIWGRSYPLNPARPAQRLIDHPVAEERNPAAVMLNGKPRIFWQSTRRRLTTDIWTSELSGGLWSAPARVTSGAPRDLTPAAVVEPGGALHLVWCGDLGNRSRIFHQTLLGGAWSAPELVSSPSATDAATYRDEAPTAAFVSGQLRVFWHSNRSGRTNLWTRAFAGGAWGPITPALDRATGEKDPAAIVDAAGQIRLFWRSQLGGELFRSRTVDTAHPETWKPTLGKLGDRARYTYDGARAITDWYAADTVGVYFDQQVDTPQNRQELQRIRAFVESFRPVSTRFLWFLGSTPVPPSQP
jgi:hypothetical protein